MKVTKAKRLNPNTIRFVLHATDNTATPLEIQPWLGLLNRSPDAKRGAWRREGNNPNQGTMCSGVAVLSAAGQNEPHGVALRLFALVTFI
ncbi:hypothetical protein [Rhizobacter sp. P5_C2]